MLSAVDLSSCQGRRVCLLWSLRWNVLCGGTVGPQFCVAVDAECMEYCSAVFTDECALECQSESGRHFGLTALPKVWQQRCNHSASFFCPAGV